MERRLPRNRRILETLAEEGPIHTAKLARICSIPKSTLERDLEWLQSEGLCHGHVSTDDNVPTFREPDQLDRPLKCWWITESGAREVLAVNKVLSLAKVLVDRGATPLTAAEFHDLFGDLPTDGEG